MPLFGCVVAGCTNSAVVGGFCKRHYPIRPAGAKVGRVYGHKERARYTATHAAKNGLLEKPKLCMACGKESESLDKHHLNYDLPLMVLWLCPPCHGRLDSQLRIPAPGEHERIGNEASE